MREIVWAVFDVGALLVALAGAFILRARLRRRRPPRRVVLRGDAASSLSELDALAERAAYLHVQAQREPCPTLILCSMCGVEATHRMTPRCSEAQTQSDHGDFLCTFHKCEHCEPRGKMSSAPIKKRCACGWERPLIAVTSLTGRMPPEDIVPIYVCPRCGKPHVPAEMAADVARQLLRGLMS